MKKLSLQQIQSLLKALGVEVAVAESDAADFNLDETLSQIDTSRRSFIEPAIKSEYDKEANGKFKGRHLNEIRALAKKAFGLTEDQLKELEGAQIFDLIKQKTTEGAGATEQTLRDEITRMSTAHGDAITKLKTEHEQALAAERGQYELRDIYAYAAGIINKIPRHGGDPMKQAEAFVNSLQTRFGVKWDANNKRVSLRDLKNLEVDAKNEAGTQLVSLEDEAKAYLTDQGIFKPGVKDNSVLAGMGKQVSGQQGRSEAPAGNNIPGSRADRMAALESMRGA